MGPSGSGKTTLLNILATIDTPTSGSVEIGGVSPVKLHGDQ
ncbi:MAG: ATP-binding cassette domain-containing protein, partial [Firmicutes bacterium]|nr:ATP-binding cassette domain-containing protein [Bacillota bacterium]